MSFGVDTVPGRAEAQAADGRHDLKASDAQILGDVDCLTTFNSSMLLCIGALCTCCTAIVHVQQPVKYWSGMRAFWTKRCCTDQIVYQIVQITATMDLSSCSMPCP
ncbi:TPA: hypothetical protein ACH3X3_004266 [Trebouxia sp. C0006]